MYRKIVGLVAIAAALLIPIGLAQAEPGPSGAPAPEELCMYSPSPHSLEVEALMAKTVILSVNPDAACPPPRVSISASPNPVTKGGSTTLSWYTDYVDIGCQADPTGPG